MLLSQWRGAVACRRHAGTPFGAGGGAGSPVVVIAPRNQPVILVILLGINRHCLPMEKIVFLDSGGEFAAVLFRWKSGDGFEAAADKIELCALPEAILQAYNKGLPKRKKRLIADAVL